VGGGGGGQHCLQHFCLSRCERLEHEGRDLRTVGGTADADTHTGEALGGQALGDGAQAVVTSSAAAAFDGDFANCALEIVVDNEKVCGGGAKVLQCLAHGLSMVEVLQKRIAGRSGTRTFPDSFMAHLGRRYVTCSASSTCLGG
jgi:hypothetical protein